MSKPFYTALIAASVIFSTTLLVVAQQSGAVNGLAGAAPALPLASNPLGRNPAAIEAGAKLFSRTCAECHGAEGEGDPSAAPPLTNVSFIHGYEDAEVFHTIRYGVAKTDMEAHPKFTDEETWQLVAFVKSLSGPPRQRTFTETYCIGCHGDWAKTAGLSLEGVPLNDIRGAVRSGRRCCEKFVPARCRRSRFMRVQRPRLLPRLRPSWKPPSIGTPHFIPILGRLSRID